MYKSVFATRIPSVFLILCLSVSLIGCGSGSDSRQINITPPVETQSLPEYITSQDFSGSVYIAEAGEIILEQGFGKSNRATDHDNSPETIYRLGSITKQFTAAAMLLLQEDGLLTLQDSVQTYISDFPNGDIITLRHLLTHTSGLPNYTALSDFPEKALQYHTPEQLLALFKDLPLEFSPGAQFKYSNSGYAVLGVVIEQVSGKTYEDFINTRIFEPLEMANSGYGKNTPETAMQAQGYSADGSMSVNIDMSLPYSAGALISSTRDLVKWDVALTQNTLLTEESKIQMFTPDLNQYALGWQVLTTSSNETYHVHGGGISGFSTVIMRFPETQRLVIVLSNVEEYPAQNLAVQLGNKVWGQ